MADVPRGPRAAGPRAAAPRSSRRSAGAHVGSLSNASAWARSHATAATCRASPVHERADGRSSSLGVGGGLVDELRARRGRRRLRDRLHRRATSAIALFGAEGLAEHLAAAGLAPRPRRSSPRHASSTGRTQRASRARAARSRSRWSRYWCAPLRRSHPFVVVRVVLDTPGANSCSPATAVAAMRAACRSLVSVARALVTPGAGYRPMTHSHGGR